jgi:exo-beta-1,3-glucanase (GH17 family)
MIKIIWNTTQMKKIAFILSILLFCIFVAVWLVDARTPVVKVDHSVFFDYLHQTNPRPMMIAYNPSNINPDNLQISTSELEAHIHKDLACLRTGFDGLVLYSYNPAITPLVIEQAYAFGYRAVLLGIWDVKSNKEITGVIDIIKKYYGKMAFAVIIGNEGINDTRYTFADLNKAADILKDEGLVKMKVPLATSEPMAKYGMVELRRFGDFLAPNIHPAIDRGDLNPKDAVLWVQGRAKALVQISKKPVLVKETGLPNGGNPNFTPQHQYDFWQAWYDAGVALPTTQENIWISLAAVFEAFDSPWKASKSGNPVEGHWGVLNEYLQPYPAFKVFSGKQEDCHP